MFSAPDAVSRNAPSILSSWLPEVGVVRYYAHHLHREEKCQQGDEGGQPDGDIVAHAHYPVYSIEPALAVILGDKHSGPALNAEDDERQYKKHGVCHGYGGDLGLAQRAYHEGIGKRHEIRDEVLQYHREHQGYGAPVKAPALSQVVHFIQSLVPPQGRALRRSRRE